MKANSGGVSRFGLDEGKNEVNEINLDEKTRKYRDDIIKGMGKTYSVDESNKSILKNQKRDFEIVPHVEPDQINGKLTFNCVIYWYILLFYQMVSKILLFQRKQMTEIIPVMTMMNTKRLKLWH
jgi:hypothetical protein